jgi:hypothetical protein
MPGVLIMAYDANVVRVVEDLLLIADCAQEHDLQDHVRYLPL